MTQVYTVTLPARTVTRWDKRAKRFVAADAPGGAHDVEIEVDFDRIARLLGRKAVDNVGGKAVALGGAVTVRRKSP